ncbi:hypothetical protein D7X55_03610 [Corallococcus sp. AB049A]|nr:hypothetical protein D7X55_03610 [Corallococcus sp. AB049A]
MGQRAAAGAALLVLLGGAAPPAQDGIELKRFKASEKSDAMYVLRATGCRKAGDTCRLELGDGKRKVTLPGGMAYGIEPGALDSWTSGEEERSVTLEGGSGYVKAL